MAVEKGTGRPSKSGYRLASGERVPSVTTVLGRFKESGALLQWAFEQGKLAEQGVIGHLYDKRDEAADIGQVAHDMAEQWIHGHEDVNQIAKEAFPDNPEAQDKAMLAFRMFHRWTGISSVEWLSTEVPIVSEKWQVGGTVDAIARVGGKLAVVDFKTSKALYSEYWIQVAAYAAMWEEVRGERIEEIHILRFGKDRPDFEHQFRLEWDGASEAFYLMRRLYDMVKEVK